jgi:hypothetical protein
MYLIHSTGAQIALQNLNRVRKSSMLWDFCGLYFSKKFIYLSVIALLIGTLLTESHLYVAAKAGANFSGNFYILQH